MPHDFPIRLGLLNYGLTSNGLFCISDLKASDYFA